ncbi:hypothetical protein P2S10_19645, partial [Escherichia coli]
SAGCQLSQPGGLGSDHPTLDLINKAVNFSKNKRHRLCATFFIINLEERTLPGIADKERIISLQ